MSAIQAIVVPKWGMEMEEGTIQEWHVEEGSPINKGDELVDIETSKIVNTLESNVSGVLRRRVAQVGVTLPVGSLLGVCAGEDVADADIEQFMARYLGQLDSEPAVPEDGKTSSVSAEIIEARADDKVKASPSARKLARVQGIDLGAVKGTGPRGRISKEDVQAALAKNSKPDRAVAPGNNEVKISPVARRLAGKLGVDISAIQGTGTHGRISKEDVERAAAQLAGPAAVETEITAPAPRTSESGPEASEIFAGGDPATDFNLIPLSATRRTIARRLTEAKQTVPHFYLSVNCELDRLQAFREEINQASNEKTMPRISLNDLILKASALALRDIPIVNSQYSEEGIRQFHHAHISLAVATERGLLTPVIKDVCSKSLGQLARESRALIAKAQSGQLAMDDISGGTFSVSNLGMLGVEEFAAVINPPQGAILAVGAAKAVPAVRNGNLTTVQEMKVTLSCDHRVIDGADGARWLQAFKGYIESPATLLL